VATVVFDKVVSSNESVIVNDKLRRMSALKMEAVCFSETLLTTRRATETHIKKGQKYKSSPY
jgi:hypothetical protein